MLGAANPREETPGAARRLGRGFVLALTLLFVIAAVSVSAGLLAYTAWRHDLKNGLFALSFAVLSARAMLSWCLWRRSWSADQQVS